MFIGVELSLVWLWRKSHATGAELSYVWLWRKSRAKVAQQI